MMLLALAQADPPEEVDLDDVERWEKLTDAALDGPDGCWDIAGGIRATFSIHTRATMWSRSNQAPTPSEGTFTGRLEDGRWTSFDYTLVNTITGEKDDTSVYPMIGRIHREVPTVNGERVWTEEKLEKAEKRAAKYAKKKRKKVEEGQNAEVRDPGNILRRVLDNIDTQTAVSIASWRDSLDGVQLDQDIPMDESSNPKVVHLTTIFPKGTDFPSRLSATFPRKLTFGSFPVVVTLVDTQMHLVQFQVRDKVLPMTETASTIASALGFTVGLEQRLDYRKATPCGP